MEFGEDILKIVEYARDEAMRTGHYGISQDHLVLGMIRHRDNPGADTLAALGIDLKEMKDAMDSAMMRPSSIPYGEINGVRLSESSRNAMNLGAVEAVKGGRDRVDARDLLAGVCRGTGSLAKNYLANHGISAASISGATGLKDGRDSMQALPRAEDIASALEAEIRTILRDNGPKDRNNTPFS